MNLITFIWIIAAAFVLCRGVASNTISVEFAVRDCTSNCVSIKNPVGKVRLYGISEIYHIRGDNGYPTWTELSEQTFTTTEVPFTVNIEYPDDVVSIIEADYEAVRVLKFPEGGIPEDTIQYEVSIIWDADDNSVSICDGDITIDDYSYLNAGVDLTKSETQTVYIKKIEDTGTCEGEILLKFTTKNCETGDTCSFNNVKAGWGKISLYGYDSTNNADANTLIHQQDFEIEGSRWIPPSAPIKLPMPFPENPWSFIEGLANKQDAKYYVEMDKCGLQVVKENEEFQNVDLAERTRWQTIYIQEGECDSACGHVTFVKLLCLYFVFYVFL
eukprot:191777_1